MPRGTREGARYGHKQARGRRTDARLAAPATPIRVTRLGVAVGHDGHRQLDSYPLVREQVQHDLLNRAALSTGKGYVLHHRVAPAQPVGHPVDEGADLPRALNVPDAQVVDSGLAGEGAYERFGLAMVPSW
jgi:hypothetical protein